MNIEQYLDQRRQEIDRFLESAVPAADTVPTLLYQSMRYSLLAGGKRIRPILTLAAAEAVGSPPSAIFAVASAFELIHTYSLIHDDLPAMDNDDFRRGKPTNHKVYGDAMAILAGDALQTMAFEFCCRPDFVFGLSPVLQIQAIHELVIGSGRQGMVAGQVLDMQSEHQAVDKPTLEDIHVHKTGRLIRAAVRVGGILSNATTTQLARLTDYAEHIGLAFQIADDVLNVTGTREDLGKDPNTDAERGKMTYPSLYGLDQATIMAKDHMNQAIEHLTDFDEKADPLRELARFIVDRKH
ncbi:MAG: geranyl transferase [Nitrospirales bacterium]|nr:geranyl transferase [Nitrospirales bacterium]